jgi:hypothetical protein
MNHLRMMHMRHHSVASLSLEGGQSNGNESALMSISRYIAVIRLNRFAFNGKPCGLLWGNRFRNGTAPESPVCDHRPNAVSLDEHIGHRHLLPDCCGDERAYLCAGCLLGSGAASEYFTTCGKVRRARRTLPCRLANCGPGVQYRDQLPFGSLER